MTIEYIGTTKLANHCIRFACTPSTKKKTHGNQHGTCPKARFCSTTRSTRSRYLKISIKPYTESRYPIPRLRSSPLGISDDRKEDSMFQYPDDQPSRYDRNSELYCQDRYSTVLSGCITPAYRPGGLSTKQLQISTQQAVTRQPKNIL